MNVREDLWWAMYDAAVLKGLGQEHRKILRQTLRSDREQQKDVLIVEDVSTAKRTKAMKRTRAMAKKGVTQAVVEVALADGLRTVEAIIGSTGRSTGQVQTALYALERSGKVTRTRSSSKNGSAKPGGIPHEWFLAKPDQGLSPLDQEVRSLCCSVRIKKRLNEIGIRYVGELVQKSEAEITTGATNFGRKSLWELKDVLAEMGLGLGRHESILDGRTPPE